MYLFRPVLKLFFRRVNRFEFEGGQVVHKYGKSISIWEYLLQWFVCLHVFKWGAEKCEHYTGFGIGNQ